MMMDYRVGEREGERKGKHACLIIIGVVLTVGNERKGKTPSFRDSQFFPGRCFVITGRRHGGKQEWSPRFFECLPQNTLVFSFS